MGPVPTKERLLEWVESRVDSCRRDEVEASIVSSMLDTWGISVIPFLLGLFIGLPSALDPSWRTVIGLGLFLVAFLGFRRLDVRVAKPAAALVHWVAARYDALIELYLLGAIQENDFHEGADSIKKSHVEWLEKANRVRFQAMKQKRLESRGARILFSRLTESIELLKFARGEIGGPWDYLD